MNIRDKIGSRIKSLRRAKGYSQEELAEVVSISPKYLSSIERGQENPTLDLFIRLSQGLKVELYEIFQLEHEGEDPKRLKNKLKTLSGEIKNEDLHRILRVLEALIH